MHDPIPFVIQASAMGVAATALMDLWALYLARAFASRGLDYALLGRWLAGLPHGRIRPGTTAIRGERAMGWMAHYLTGVAFAGRLLMLAGPAWEARPTPGPALAFGIATVAFPFLVLQPALGAGVAASRTPDPTAARLRSLGSHTVFGAGLYFAARLSAAL